MALTAAAGAASLAGPGALSSLPVWRNFCAGAAAAVANASTWQTRLSGAATNEVLKRFHVGFCYRPTAGVSGSVLDARPFSASVCVELEACGGGCQRCQSRVEFCAVQSRSPQQLTSHLTPRFAACFQILVPRASDRPTQRQTPPPLQTTDPQAPSRQPVASQTRRELRHRRKEASSQSRNASLSPPLTLREDSDAERGLGCAASEMQRTQKELGRLLEIVPQAEQHLLLREAELIGAAATALQQVLIAGGSSPNLCQVHWTHPRLLKALLRQVQRDEGWAPSVFLVLSFQVFFFFVAD